MGILRAISDSIMGSFADQWKELITVNPFDELTAVVPGYLKSTNSGEEAILVDQKML